TVTTPGTYDSNVGFYNNTLSLTGGQNYTATFWARSTVAHHVHLMVDYGQPNPTYVADATVGAGTTWTQYTVQFTMPQSATNAQILFALGDAAATTWLDGISVALMANPVQRRDFTNGVVLVNASPMSQTVNLGSGYCHLRGDQNSGLNNGAPVSSVTIPSQDGLILTLCTPPAPTGTKTSAPLTPTTTGPPTPPAATRTATT